jgi:16S rRNA pseudouridine516 synthase
MVDIVMATLASHGGLATCSAGAVGDRWDVYSDLVPRLVDLLARNLGMSRTAAVRLITAGRVRNTDGVPHQNKNLDLPAGDASGQGTVVTVDDQLVSLWDRAVVLQHKPRGVVTALRDDRHETAYDLLRDAPLHGELRAVGRLDLDTSGLLLWTTDGALIQRLTHPKRRVPRRYQAALARPCRFADAAGLVLEDGHRPEISALGELDAAEVHPALLLPSDTAALAAITIVGGAYHEVRRIFAALGSHVLALCRVGYGDCPLPADLPAGGWRCVPPPGIPSL